MSPSTVQLSAQDVARYNIIRELVETERKYVQDFDLLQKYANSVEESKLLDHCRRKRETTLAGDNVEVAHWAGSLPHRLHLYHVPASHHDVLDLIHRLRAEPVNVQLRRAFQCNIRETPKGVEC
ncbi:hypothetical protein B0H17DRAFT_1213868 [Mycena rosella]|uniref:DH domain-containing protein n=1 Tax=Mycena rosella TaxID=1033263 RepID=A0AAD7CPC1_MYCRO|nr:hypothetical protein B0H17DRAFT_1213868 [Mycena rosella]